MSASAPLPTKSTPHPMMIIAAVAVILFCLAGTAAIMGWIPSSVGGNQAPARELNDTDRAVLASQMQPAPAARGSAQPAPRQLAMNEAPAPRHAAPEAAPPARNWCSNCGNIESIREIVHKGEGSGLGAAGGAVLGGLLGNQVGGGNGRKLATVAGAVGGAVVGNQVEGNMKSTRSYEIHVRLDDGSARTVRQQSAAGWHTGERVKIVNGALRAVG